MTTFTVRVSYPYYPGTFNACTDANAITARDKIRKFQHSYPSHTLTIIASDRKLWTDLDVFIEAGRMERAQQEAQS